jgi:hypothetical protein
MQHELAHYRRGDVWRLIFARLLALPHWFNPLAWHAVGAIELASEYACDDFARRGGRECATGYARMLLAIGESRSRPPAWTTGGGGGCLFKRISRVLSTSGAKDSVMKRALILVVFLVATLATVVRVELVAQESSQRADESSSASVGESTEAASDLARIRKLAKPAPVPFEEIEAIVARATASHDAGQVYAEVAAASALTVDEIREKLLQRHAHFESLEIRWSATHTTRKGVMSTYGGGTLPARDTSHKLHYRVVFQNDKVRHTRTGPSWNPGTWSQGGGSFIDAEQTCTYDGTTTQSYLAVPLGEASGAGFVFLRNPGRVHTPIIRDWQYSPVIFAFRPLSKTLEVLHLALVGSPSSVKWNGTSCLIVHDSLVGDSNREIWIDEQRGLVVRVRLLHGRAVKDDLTIKYSNKPNIGTVPVSWEYTRYSPRSGQVLESSVVRDVVYKRLSDVPDSEFSIAWKPGTSVHDDNDPGKWFLADEHGKLHLEP